MLFARHRLLAAWCRVTCLRGCGCTREERDRKRDSEYGVSDVIDDNDEDNRAASPSPRHKNEGSRVSELGESGSSDPGGKLEVVGKGLKKGVEGLVAGEEDLAVVGGRQQPKVKRKKKKEAGEETGSQEGTDAVTQVVRDQVRQLRAKKTKKTTVTSNGNSTKNNATEPTPEEARKACAFHPCLLSFSSPHMAVRNPP